MIILLGAVIAALAANKNKATAAKPKSTTGNISGGAKPFSVTRDVSTGVAGVSTTVHKNAVGTALSAALGNVFHSPAHYSTGTPGTNGITLPPSSSILYMRPRHTTTMFTKTVSNPTGGNKTVPYHSGQAGEFTRNDPPKPHHAITTTQHGKKKITYSALVNPSQSARPIIGPEQPPAFWTKMPVRTKAKK